MIVKNQRAPAAHAAHARRLCNLARRRWVLGTGLGLGAVMARADASGSAEPRVMRDVISKPPSPRQFVSPSGRFTLMLQLAVPERPPRVSAQLFDNASAAPSQPLWQQVLPHEWGPRTALVTNEGRVVLVDEWINVVSRRALTVLDVQGKTQRVHHAEEVFKLLDVPRRSISDAATAGPWRTGEPVLSADGETVELRSAQRRLLLSTRTGQLTLAN